MENGHLCASLCLLQGLEMAEMKEPQGGVPTGQRRGPKKPLPPEQGAGGRAGQGRGREGHGQTSKGTHRKTQSRCGLRSGVGVRVRCGP